MERKEKGVSIFVATHKKMNISFPIGYYPMQVNCANNNDHWEGYYHDDEGDNISKKNPSYCELTVLYSAWKNCDSTIKGLVHYRRYMSNRTDVELNTRILCNLEHLEEDVISEAEIRQRILGENADVLLVMPQGPYPITAREELRKYVYEKDIQILTETIYNEYPEYCESYEKVMASKLMYYFNMLIAKKDVFDNYCEWLFGVLEKVEKKCDITGYDAQHKRLFGYLAEVLLDVYFENQNIKKAFLGMVNPYQYMDKGTFELYKQQKRTRKLLQILHNMQIGLFIDRYHRKKNPELYEVYEAVKEYVTNQGRGDTCK